MRYQWLHNGKNMSRATGKTYTPTAKDHGNKLSARVHASVLGVRPLVHGLRADSVRRIWHFVRARRESERHRRVRSPLTASHSTFKPKVSVKYTWLRNGKAKSMSTGKTYKLTRTDRGKRISVCITGTFPGYKAATKTSASLHVR
ncbi:hypothetical protein [Paeniglutamicibacter kerguelensis]|uniref:Uncharacterized protein n=1 Tax=Paeniglutamicibacter kerguelensis TaxID=254788 RepID=A0ABS4XJ85_9MICC|nr:hypothetical protein [Paeniglutamicibacter kerguelensis]MBP2388426.1 hypothetical protein [Paeniglutamicibacter kerguelensis]